MKAHGVSVFTHPLKYSACQIIDRNTPPCPHGYYKIVNHDQAREKGIDLRIGLDMLRLARHREYDVAVLVSEDADLNQVVTELLALRQELGIWLAAENVYAFSAASGLPSIWLGSCRRRLVIDEAIFARIRDDTDYSV